jgi:hypothetical protein
MDVCEATMIEVTMIEVTMIEVTMIEVTMVTSHRMERSQFTLHVVPTTTVPY